ITLEGNERRAGVDPVLQLVDAGVIQRLAAGAALEQRARDIDHVRRMRALVEQRRPAAAAEAAHRPGWLVLVARDLACSGGQAKALAPAAHISGVGGAMCQSTGALV